MTIRDIRPRATEPERSHAVPSGVLGSWACAIRSVIPAPAAAMDSVIGRWLNSQFAMERPSIRGGRRPTTSK